MVEMEKPEGINMQGYEIIHTNRVGHEPSEPSGERARLLLGSNLEQKLLLGSLEGLRASIISARLARARSSLLEVLSVYVL